MWSPVSGLPRAVRGLVGAAMLLAGCGGAAPLRDAAAMADGSEASGGSDLPPVVRLRYQTQPPRDDGDYPYGASDPAPVAPAPDAPVYLSAQGSIDPEGRPVRFFWNAQGPDGEYLTISPDPTAVRPSFVPMRIGPHTVTLEVIETGGLHQIAQMTVMLTVVPALCALDGVSAPCADELPVPGGSFVAGTQADAGFDNEHPAHAVTVAPFLMDRYEVTVGRFRRYLTSYDPAMPATATVPIPYPEQRLAGGLGHGPARKPRRIFVRGSGVRGGPGPTCPGARRRCR